MEVAPVLLRQLAAPQLVHDLVPPVVLAALALLQLRHALQGAAPQQVSAVVRQEVRLGISGRAQPRRPPAAGHVRKVATARRRQLVEVAKQRPQKAATPRPRRASTGWPMGPPPAAAARPVACSKEKGAGRERDGPVPVRLRQQARVDHADLVDNEPSPVTHSLCRLLAHGAVQRGRVDAKAAGVVEGPPANVGRVDGLERRHLPRNDLAKHSSKPELARAS